MVLAFKSTKVLEIQRLTISPFQVVDDKDHSPTSLMTLPDHHSVLVSDWIFSKVIVVEYTGMDSRESETRPKHAAAVRSLLADGMLFQFWLSSGSIKHRTFDSKASLEMLAGQNGTT